MSGGMFQGQQGGTKRGSSTHGDDQHWGGMDCSGAGGGGGGGGRGGGSGGCHDEDHGGAYDAHRKRTRRSSPSPPRGPAGMFRELSVQDEDGAAMGDSMGATVRDSSMGSMGSMGSSEGGCSEGGCSEDGGGERGGGEGGGGAVEVAVKMIGGRLEHMALPFGAVVRDIKVELEEKRGVERTQIVLIHKGKVCGDMERATAGALYMHCHPQSGCNR